MTKAIRGAVQFSEDNSEKMKERIQYMLDRMLAENGITEEHIISIFFSITDDLKSVNPAAALRAGGKFSNVPLFCAQEPDTEGAMPMVVRVLLTCDYGGDDRTLSHIYLDGAEKLRPDLKQ